MFNYCLFLFFLLFTLVSWCFTMKHFCKTLNSQGSLVNWYFSCVQLFFLGHPRCFVFSKAIFLNYQWQKLWTSHPHNVFSTPHTTPHTNGTRNWNIPFLKFVSSCNCRKHWTFTRIRLNFLIFNYHMLNRSITLI